MEAASEIFTFFQWVWFSRVTSNLSSHRSIYSFRSHWHFSCTAWCAQLLIERFRPCLPVLVQCKIQDTTLVFTVTPISVVMCEYKVESLHALNRHEVTNLHHEVHVYMYIYRHLWNSCIGMALKHVPTGIFRYGDKQTLQYLQLLKYYSLYLEEQWVLLIILFQVHFFTCILIQNSCRKFTGGSSFLLCFPFGALLSEVLVI